MNACQKTKTSVKRQAGIASDLTQIVEASQQMENMLDIILAYVDDVISGAKSADNTFGRLLLDMIHSVPKMTPEEFEEMLNSNRKVSRLNCDDKSCESCLNYVCFVAGFIDGSLSVSINKNPAVTQRKIDFAFHLNTLGIRVL